MVKTKRLSSVDVAIITYNQEKYIEECINSVLDQDYDNLKIYVADDCSTDSTPIKVKGIAEKYPDKVFYLKPEKNQGVTKNANLGLLAGNGDFVIAMGGDDVLLPGKISKQVEWFLKDENRVLCGHKVHYCNSKSEITGVHSKPMKQGNTLTEWLRYGPIFCSLAIMMKRSKIPKYGFDVRLPLSSDWKLSVDTLKNGGEYGYIDEFLGLYRRHESNLTNNPVPLRNDSINTLKFLREELDPKWRRDLDFGYGFIVQYGYGVNLIKVGNYKKAAKHLLMALKYIPLNFKVYYRLLICLINFYKW